ncbi:kinesin-like protein KIF27 isoform X2 [Lineus longissimus]|uniref:kinesin-like protein KIF27 isoform X2 n=1 Tax=Lineus longissimus TaxID=88925 RepID=UPI002B4DDD02
MDEVNVKVAVRVRPLLQREKLSSETSCVKIIPANNQIILGKDRAFTFDHVLGPKNTQEELYENCFKPLIAGCFEGYNCTVFAYGQTGSGKTYTIGGGNIADLTEDEFGILPRAIKHIFARMEEHKHIDYKVKVSYFEVYKEELADLLDPDPSSKKDLHIREDDKGITVIIGAREVECESMEEVMSCLEAGSSVRHTGSTQMNEQSSRSHSIFTMLIEQSWCEPETPVRDQSDDEELDGDMTHYISSKFHFVDLAGSERAHKTGNTGDRFKESVHINTGLLSLGNVISALGDPKKKSTHIPYRDAKITRILKDSLGGNAQTLMVCCISPSSASFDESLNSLKYANRAKNIKNKPIINRDPQSIRFEEMQSEIRALREELSRQRSSLITADMDSVTSARAVEDASAIRSLEEKIVRLQTECSHYRMITEEAYKQITDIQQQEILSSSQNARLREWLDLMEELQSKVPATLNRDGWDNQTINRLHDELKKCREDLKSDERIFAEKSIEINSLKERLADLEESHQSSSLSAEELLDKTKKQEQKLVEQQLKIEELERRLKEQDRLLSIGSSHDSQLPMVDDLPPISSRRAKSVPANMIKRQSSTDTADPLATRKIHTSPALISLERVMQGFRARSQLLANQLEDEDEVRQPSFDNGKIEEEEGPKPFTRKNTYKIKKKKGQEVKSAGSDRTKSGIPQPSSERASSAKSKSRKDNSKSGDSVFGSQVTDGDVKQLQDNTLLQKRKIKESQLKLQNANQKMRDLSINIRLKEQLIRDLVKSSKESESLNKQYADKIKALEKERVAAKADVAETQKALQELGAKEQQETNEKKRLQTEFQKKIEAAKSRMKTLQRKQMETEKMANITGQNDKRIGELEFAIDKMRQQQQNLNKKLKDEADNKEKMEREMFRDQHKIKELEMRNEQQSKVLRIKTEETAALHRKLRHGSATVSQKRWAAFGREKHWRGEQEKVEEQRRWLDSEIEKVLNQRKKMEELQEELKKREEIIAKKEGILAEKSELEIKKLRSSQHVNKDILSVANKLEAVEKKLQEKTREMAQTPEEERAELQKEVQNLEHGREVLMRQRNVLDEKLHGGNLLSADEERRLIELEEAIEALEAAIEYKTDAISSRQEEIRRSHLSLMDDNHLLAKLSSLSGNDSKALLTKYFEKVITLREQERTVEYKNSELETKVDEQTHLIRELELTLDRTSADTDRRLTQQQQAHEKKIQLLMHQLAELERGGDAESSVKVLQLEKDLFYYKKTSRDLKRRIRELMAKGGMMQEGDEIDASLRSVGTPRDHGEGGPRGSSRPSSVRENREPTPRSSRSVAAKKVEGNGERVVTPVKISRKELRQMTEEEISLRKSNASQASITDSLEVQNDDQW